MDAACPHNRGHTDRLLRGAAWAAVAAAAGLAALAIVGAQLGTHSAAVLAAAVAMLMTLLRVQLVASSSLHAHGA